MCRLLGYVANVPRSAVDVLGAEAFEDFVSLSRLHCDGWGMAWQGGAGIEWTTSPTTAANDPRFRNLARTPLAPAGLVHLRWATSGLRVAPENTHPFVDEGLCLAHNGTIQDIARLESLLSGRARAALRGTTDSERYFQFVLDRIASNGDEAVGIRDAVGILAREFPTASLNAVLLGPSMLYAVHVNSGASAPVDDLRDLFGSEDAMPVGHAERYFDLSYRVDDSCVRVVSTGLGSAGWTPLPPDSIMSVELATRRIRFDSLDLPVRVRTAMAPTGSEH